MKILFDNHLAIHEHRLCEKTCSMYLPLSIDFLDSGNRTCSREALCGENGNIQILLAR